MKAIWTLPLLLLFASYAQAEQLSKEHLKRIEETCLTSTKNELVCECVLSRVKYELSTEDVVDGSLSDGAYEQVFEAEGRCTEAFLALPVPPKEAPAKTCKTKKSLRDLYELLSFSDESGSSERVDLNGDGLDEVLITHIGCGTSACTHYVFEYVEGGDLCQIMKSHDKNFFVLDQEEGGWKMIGTSWIDTDDWTYGPSNWVYKDGQYINAGAPRQIVSVEKAYFHTRDGESFEKGKAYVIQGDEVEALGGLLMVDDYVQVRYTHPRRGTVTEGWLKADELKK